MEQREVGRRAFAFAPPAPSPSTEFRLDRRFLRLLLFFGWCIPVALGVADGGARLGAGRSLLGFRETQGNASFQCSPSGPCLPCQYSEKNDEKYRCSETGYRIPLKCVEVKDESEETSGKRPVRNFLSVKDSQGATRSYITYRSCLPVEAEERLSVIGFEMIMVGLLLISGPVVYIRQKRNIPLPGFGAVRIPTSSLRL